MDSRMRFVTAALALAMVPVMAVGQEKAPDPIDAAIDEFKAARKKIMEKHDADGDGRLSREEWKAARDAGTIRNQIDISREGVRSTVEKRYDTDGDGQLDANERAEMERAREEQMKQWRQRAEDMRKEAEEAAKIRKFDKDGDGELNPEEKAAMEAADAAEAERLAKLAKEIIAKYDTNKDKVLSDEELAAMKEAVQKQLDHLKGIVEVSQQMKKSDDKSWEPIEQLIITYRFTANAWGNWRGFGNRGGGASGGGDARGGFGGGSNRGGFGGGRSRGGQRGPVLP